MGRLSEVSEILKPNRRMRTTGDAPPGRLYRMGETNRAGINIHKIVCRDAPVERLSDVSAAPKAIGKTDAVRRRSTGASLRNSISRRDLRHTPYVMHDKKALRCWALGLRMNCVKNQGSSDVVH